MYIYPCQYCGIYLVKIYSTGRKNMIHPIWTSFLKVTINLLDFIRTLACKTYFIDVFIFSHNTAKIYSWIIQNKCIFTISIFSYSDTFHHLSLWWARFTLNWLVRISMISSVTSTEPKQSPWWLKKCCKHWGKSIRNYHYIVKYQTDSA